MIIPKEKGNRRFESRPKSKSAKREKKKQYRKGVITDAERYKQDHR